MCLAQASSLPPEGVGFTDPLSGTLKSILLQQNLMSVVFRFQAKTTGSYIYSPKLNIS
jgi:hypothetical protein